MKIKQLILVSCLAIPSMANAADTIFSCVTKNNKMVSVLKSGNNYIYSFGKVGSNDKELTFKNPISQVVGRQGSSHIVGTQYINTSLEMRNGKYSYIIYRDSPFREEPSVEEGGVLVLKNGKQLADVKCDKKSVYSNFDSKLLESLFFK